MALKGIGSKADTSLKLGFDWLVRMIIKQKELMQQRIDEDVQRQKAEETRIRKEKSARLDSTYNRSDYNRDEDDDNDADKYKNPWKPLNELKVCAKDSLVIFFCFTASHF